MKKILLIIISAISWTVGILAMVFIVPTISNGKKQEEIKPIEKVEIIEEIITESIKETKRELAEEISDSVIKASKKYNIPTYVIYALIATESGKNSINQINSENILDVNTEAKSSYNCIGLTQVSPKFALVEYNKYFKTNYKEEDLYNIDLNIDVGTWYFSQFRKVANNYIEMYVIYNVGYSKYNKINSNWFYGKDGKWYNNYRNSFFYMNDLLPPETSWTNGLYGKNKLKPYNAKKRFEKCLYIFKNELNY